MRSYHSPTRRLTPVEQFERDLNLLSTKFAQVMTRIARNHSASNSDLEFLAKYKTERKRLEKLIKQNGLPNAPRKSKRVRKTSVTSPRGLF